MKLLVVPIAACFVLSLSGQAPGAQSGAAEQAGTQQTNAGAPDARRQQAVTLAIDGEYEQALKIFLDLVRQAPEDPALNYYTGLTLLRLKRAPEAMSYFERSVREKASFPQPYIELAGLYLDKKLKPQAEKTIEQGLRLFPKHKPLLALEHRLEDEEP